MAREQRVDFDLVMVLIEAGLELLMGLLELL
jgi:hypothetical protein